jgi:hypothetical protein
VETAVIAGEDVRVGYNEIEKSLADLWRAEKKTSDDAVMRAALWNVVAHTWTPHDHTTASETLAKASALVPQRTIIVRAAPGDVDEMTSWSSEEIAIVAGGERVSHVPPLVNALLIPDMPVAVWWIGDMPHEEEAYVESLLDPADRLIVDSRHFNDAADLELLQKIAQQTTTAPADLSWVRLEEWRAATASLFDPPQMRPRLQRLQSVQIVYGGAEKFGSTVEALLYVAWLSVQSGRQLDFDIRQDEHAKGLASVQLGFDDGTRSAIQRDRERGVVLGDAGCVTRVLGRGQEDLIVRQLKRPEADRVYLKALPVATELARRR